MKKQLDKTWAIVLAGGAGTRLAAATRDAHGRSVPKQYCSLAGGRSLLGDTLARAGRVVPRERVVVVVAKEHEAWWRDELAELPAENVIVQPRPRGTAPGLLLPLSFVRARDHRARVVVLPADHYVRDEFVLEGALRQALHGVRGRDDTVTLLGITPDAAEPDYGWVVARPSYKLARPVALFVEKPEAVLAKRLLDLGGVWNSFILVAQAAALEGLIERRLPVLHAAFRAAFAGSPERAVLASLPSLYGDLAEADLSRDVLQGAEDALLLQSVPACGWTDLGTPRRVAECLAHLASRPARERVAPRPAALDLGRVLHAQSA